MSIVYKEVTKRPTETQACINLENFYKLKRIYSAGLNNQEKKICLMERELIEEVGFMVDVIYLYKVVARLTNKTESYVQKALRKYECMLMYEEYFL